jgi:hypothetical protein
MSEKSQAKVRLNADLSPEVADALKKLAAEEGITLTEALRRAISTEFYLHSKRKSGSKILLDEHGKLKELVFR